MIWFLFSLTALLLMAIYAIVSKFILTRKEENDPIAYTIIIFLGVTLLASITYFLTGIKSSDFELLLNRDSFLPLLVAVVCYSVGPSIYYKVLKTLEASEVTILYSFVGVYSLFIGLGLGTDSITLQKVFGAICIITSVILISWKKQGVQFSKYTFWLFIGTLFYAAGAVADNLVVSKIGLSPLFYQILNFGLPALGVYVLNLPSLKKLVPLVTDKINLKAIALNSVIFFAYFLSIFYAYAYGGTASGVNLILSAEAILVVLFAILFLKERDRMAQKLSAALIVALGIYLIG